MQNLQYGLGKLMVMPSSVWPLYDWEATCLMRAFPSSTQLLHQTEVMTAEGWLFLLEGLGRKALLRYRIPSLTSTRTSHDIGSKQCTGMYELHFSLQQSSCYQGNTCSDRRLWQDAHTSRVPCGAA